MKQLIFILLSIAMILTTGCADIKKQRHLPKADSDKTITFIGGENNQQAKEGVHRGEGYVITVPADSYRYEKDYDDGILEEKWDYRKKDDVEIKVTTYKSCDAKTAQGRFLREHNDYIFEDLMGLSICGTEHDGDTLWFQLHEGDAGVYFVSWEYPKNTNEDLKKELSQIVESFQIAE